MDDRYGRWDRMRGGEAGPRPEGRDASRERAVAPPIEREHQTQEGILEEDERRERERQRERS